MSDKNRKIHIRELKDPVVFVALGLGSGLSPKAPGTAGTLLTVPLGYFLMNKWLQQFVYRISVDWKLILGAFGIVFGLTILNVGYELMKASTSDPVKAIRYE